jgi:hypothetical protein
MMDLHADVLFFLENKTRWMEAGLARRQLALGTVPTL